MKTFRSTLWDMEVIVEGVLEIESEVTYHNDLSGTPFYSEISIHKVFLEYDNIDVTDCLTEKALSIIKENIEYDL